MLLVSYSIKQLIKLWKKTFQTIHQLSYFVGHPVTEMEIGICPTSLVSQRFKGIGNASLYMEGHLKLR